MDGIQLHRPAFEAYKHQTFVHGRSGRNLKGISRLLDTVTTHRVQREFHMQGIGRDCFFGIGNLQMQRIGIFRIHRFWKRYLDGYPLQSLLGQYSRHDNKTATHGENQIQQIVSGVDGAYAHREQQKNKSAPLASDLEGAIEVGEGENRFVIEFLFQGAPDTVEVEKLKLNGDFHAFDNFIDNGRGVGHSSLVGPVARFRDDPVA